MAYDFVRASSQSLTVSGPPATTTPITLFVRSYITDATTNQNLMNLLTASGTVLGFALAARGDVANDPIRTQVFSIGQHAADRTSYALNVWETAAGVVPDNASRTAYLNETFTTNSTSETPGTPNAMEIAGFRGGNTLSGQIAEAAVWSAALTAAEIASLSKGFSPRRIRPQSIVFYAPLIRNLQDLRGALSITNNNTATVAVHPRVY